MARGIVHSIVRRTELAIRRDERTGLAVSRGEGVIRLEVPPKQLVRALRLLDALFVGAEHRGWSVRETLDLWSSRQRSVPTITVDGYACEVQIKPVLRRVENEPSTDRWAARYAPTGELKLVLASVGTGRSRW